jgi:hypothetical protein
MRRDEVLDDVSVLCRLGAGGPVMCSVPMNAFWLRSTVEGHLNIVQIFDDGDYLVENTIFAWHLPADVRVNLRIMMAGVTFDDGTIVRDVSAAAFSDTGVYAYRTIRPGDTTYPSVCHRTTLFQGEWYIGTRR